jgi:glycosyltransferase involved in cell wall biosynthesis
MIIVLIAPGFQPFPPKGWGAVESVVWDYYENLKNRGYNVVIVNTPDYNKMINETNSNNPDVVHIMYDDYIVAAPAIKCNIIYYTSHYAYLTHPQFEQTQQWYFNNIFRHVISFKNLIFINAISEEIKQIYIKYGFPEHRINVICNGAREDLFRFSTTPSKSGKSVYIAKIEIRKAQVKYQGLPNIDFVGNYYNSHFDITNPNYLGEWDKPTLYNNLTEYGNLVLLSDGEADPLVVKEALIAGLGVVISECASANLNLLKGFITIIPNEKINDLVFVNKAIVENRKYSVENRQEIRDYALSKFSWKKVIDNYYERCLENYKLF